MWLARYNARITYYKSTAINFTAAEKRARYNVLVTRWSRDKKVFLSPKKIALIIRNTLKMYFYENVMCCN